MKDVGVGLGVKSISDLVVKEIQGICGKKNSQMKKLNAKKWLKDKYLKRFINQVKMN